MLLFNSKFLNLNSNPNKAYGANQLYGLSSDCLSSVNAAFLNAHNSYRALHGANSLRFSTSITATAQNYANYLATNGLFQHSGASGLGENLAYSSSSAAPNLNNCGGE